MPAANYPPVNPVIEQIICDVERMVTANSRLSRRIRIEHESSGFHPSLAIPVQGWLTCRYADIVRAAVSVGRLNWTEVLQYGDASRWEVIYRAAMVLAHLEPVTRRSYTGLEGTDAYYALDPSEKAAANFFVGMTLAKLFGEYLLEVPWMVHFDRYWPDRCTPYVPGDRSRPDLAGISAGNLRFLLESKGRTAQKVNRLCIAFKEVSDVLQKAKKQAEAIKDFDGNAVDYRVAFAAYQSTDIPRQPLKVFWRDPPAGDEDEGDPVARTRFIDDYYQYFLASIGEGSAIEVGRDRFIVRRFEEIDLVLGVHESIATAEDSRSREKAARAFFRRTQQPSQAAVQSVEMRASWNSSGEWHHVLMGDRERQQTSLGRDGVLVVLGSRWDIAMGERESLRPLRNDEAQTQLPL